MVARSTDSRILSSVIAAAMSASSVIESCRAVAMSWAAKRLSVSSRRLTFAPLSARSAAMLSWWASRPVIAWPEAAVSAFSTAVARLLMIAKKSGVAPGGSCSRSAVMLIATAEP